MTNPESDIDQERPVPNDDQVVCDGCWKLMEKGFNAEWSFFAFRYLKSVILCRACMADHADDLQRKQAQGL